MVQPLKCQHDARAELEVLLEIASCAGNGE